MGQSTCERRLGGQESEGFEGNLGAKGHEIQWHEGLGKALELSLFKDEPKTKKKKGSPEQTEPLPAFLS